MLYFSGNLLSPPGMERRQPLASRYKSPHLLLILILFAYLLIGIATVKDFGESFDEDYAYNYAKNSLAAYIGQGKNLRNDQGSLHVMVAKIGSDFLTKIHPQWLPIESWHFMHFLSFLAGLVFLYIICLKINAPGPGREGSGIPKPAIPKQWGAIGAVLLFSTQPLLWGHAFINYKDVPFMASFLGGIALGLVMVDSFASASVETPIPTHPSLRLSLSKEWAGMEKKRKARLIWICAIVIGIWVALLVARPMINEMIGSLVAQAFHSDPSSLVGKIFSRLAERREDIVLENYIRKAQVLYLQFFFLYTLGTIGLLILAAMYTFSTTVKRAWVEDGRPFWHSFLLSFKNGRVLAAGVMLGICSSIRTAGPLVAVLVGIYFLMKLGRKAWPVLFAYLLIAFLATYITWPSLWGSPVKNYLVSFSQSSDFNWEGKVMFAGIDYKPQDLPGSYFPTLLSIQFTETALLVFIIGILAVAIKSYRKLIDWRLSLLVGVWFLAPFLAAMIFRPTIYDNFRHFLFAIPPIFIIGSVGIQSLLERIKNVVISVLLLAVLVLPGIVGIVRLHPYEYVYYNSIVGGTSGAFREFEMDYWATSYRAATDYLNQNAPPNSSVIAWGPYWVVKDYARPDLEIIDYRRSADVVETADYAVLSTRHDKDLTLFPTAQPVCEIGRQGALFAVVKQLNSTEGAQP